MTEKTEKPELKEITMSSFQETVTKAEPQLKEIKEMLDRGYFDYNECNIFGTGYEQDKAGPLGEEDRVKIYNLVHNVPLKEFLAKSGAITGAGLQGSNYLIPVKIHDILFTSSAASDIVADMSAVMLGPADIPGTTYQIDIVKDIDATTSGLWPRKFSSGGKLAETNLEIKTATLDFSNPWGVRFGISNSLIEDSKWDLVQRNISEAGKELGEYATNEACIVMKAATDGDGTLNSASTGDTGLTKWVNATTAGIDSAIKGNLDDNWLSDTMVTTHESMLGSIILTTGAVYNESSIYNEYLHGSWPTHIGPLNVLYGDVSTMTNAYANTQNVTLVFAKQYAMISGRKRWLRLENYSDPIRDLVGAVVSCRQDSVTIYNDAIFKLTES